MRGTIIDLVRIVENTPRETFNAIAEKAGDVPPKIQELAIEAFLRGSAPPATTALMFRMDNWLARGAPKELKENPELIYPAIADLVALGIVQVSLRVYGTKSLTRSTR